MLKQKILKENDMIKVVAKCYLKESEIEKFVEYASIMVEETKKESGYVKYELYRDTEDETVFTFIEEWNSKEDLETHFETPHFKKYIPLMKEMHSKAEEVNIYKLVK